MTVVIAEWMTYDGSRGKREVATGEEASSLCNEIESRPGAGRVLVGFTAPNGHFFAIGLGHERSCGMYWESVEPPYFQTQGEGAPEVTIDFAYDGQHTELPGSVLIEKQAAVSALREFVETGTRPTTVVWEET